MNAAAVDVGAEHGVLTNSIATEVYCYLTTTGRVTGSPHEIEIWFGVDESGEASTLYLLSGGRDRSDWVRNLLVNPAVQVRVGSATSEAAARLVTDPAEDALARRLLLEKYQPGYGSDLGNWGRTALPVALDLVERP